jgi:hypothetical protein
MDKTGVIHKPCLSFHPFFSISRIASPQTLQNLVNYHPIFCPNAGDCSFFVFVLEQECRSTLAGLYKLTGHNVVAGSSKKILNIPGGFHGCRCQQTFGNDAVFWSY